MHFFMDMETLGVDEKAIVLTIGILCVPENYNLDNTIDLYDTRGSLYHLNLTEQEKRYNRTMDISTVYWWSTQNPGVFRDQLCQKDAWKMRDAIDDIRHIFQRYGLFDKDEHNIIWSRGLFEVKLWESMLKDLKIENDIMFWQWRDSRTACDVMCGDPNGLISELPDLNKHDPLADCILDYFRLKKCGAFKNMESQKNK